MPVKKDIFLTQFGNHLRELRLKKNLTQMDLAAIINKDRQNIHRMESGKVNPSIYILYELADGLDIDLSELTDFKLIVKPKKKKK